MKTCSQAKVKNILPKPNTYYKQTADCEGKLKFNLSSHQNSRKRATGTVMPAGSALLQPSISLCTPQPLYTKNYIPVSSEADGAWHQFQPLAKFNI